MTNMEFYRDEIEKMVNNNFDIAVLKNGVLANCTLDRHCDECIFDDRCTRYEQIKWLMAEPIEKPKLTKREKHFVEFCQSGWLARNEGVFHSFEKPRKNDDCWKVETMHCLIIEQQDLFPMIKDTDTEPWSVEELRKLGVIE